MQLKTLITRNELARLRGMDPRELQKLITDKKLKPAAFNGKGKPLFVKPEEK